MLLIPARMLRKVLVFKDALKSQTEYAGVIPLAPLAGGTTVFNASEKEEV